MSICSELPESLLPKTGRKKCFHISLKAFRQSKKEIPGFRPAWTGTPCDKTERSIKKNAKIVEFAEKMNIIAENRKMFPIG